MKLFIKMYLWLLSVNNIVIFINSTYVITVFYILIFNDALSIFLICFSTMYCMFYHKSQPAKNLSVLWKFPPDWPRVYKRFKDLIRLYFRKGFGIYWKFKKVKTHLSIERASELLRQCIKQRNESKHRLCCFFVCRVFKILYALS